MRMMDVYMFGERRREDGPIGDWGGGGPRKGEIGGGV